MCVNLSTCDAYPTAISVGNCVSTLAGTCTGYAFGVSVSCCAESSIGGTV